MRCDKKPPCWAIAFCLACWTIPGASAENLEAPLSEAADAGVAPSVPFRQAADQAPSAAQEGPQDSLNDKRLIGAIALIRESDSGFEFRARVDTGAKSCSLHMEEWEIPDEQEDMRKNIGKPIRFRVIGPDPEQECWIDAKIYATVIIKNSQKKERRYKVWLNLEHGGIKKRVSVTLNDRSGMKFPMLIGRNFLRGDFLVDVSTEDD